MRRIAHVFIERARAAIDLKAQPSARAEVQLLLDRAIRRPRIMPHPLIGACLEHPGLRIWLNLAFRFQVVDEKRQLDLLTEIFARLRSKIEIAQRITVAARPSTMIPRAHHQRVRSLRTTGLDRAEELQGP